LKRTAVLLILLCSFGAQGQKIHGTDLPRGVSLIRLISNPEQYDGKSVTVIGVLDLPFEGASIYVTSDDYNHANRYNRITIVPNKVVDSNCERADGKYVVLSGQFHSPGPTEDSMGQIRNITRCSVWSESLSPAGGPGSD